MTLFKELLSAKRRKIFITGFVIISLLIPQTNSTKAFPKPLIQQQNQELKTPDFVFELIETTKSNFFVDPIKLKVSESDKNCLARIIYYESGDEPMIGKYAVGQIVINRLQKGFGKTICQVVREKGQFTSINKIPPNNRNWEESKHVAKMMVEHNIRLDLVATSLYYHSTKVKPKWSKEFFLSAKIGTHIFYNEEKPFNAFRN